MDFEKMWYELKQYLIENNELDTLVYMNECEITEVMNTREIKLIKEIEGERVAVKTVAKGKRKII